MTLISILYIINYIFSVHGGKWMTVREIAKLAGVSPATVSRYLTGSENVSIKVATKIDAIIGKKSLTNKRTQKKNRNRKNIGILIQDYKLGFYQQVLAEVINQMEHFNLDIIFLVKNDIDKYGMEYVARKTNISGMIFLEEEINRSIIMDLNKLNITVVYCGCNSLENSGVKVHIDDLSAAYEGTKYLISLGHQKIKFLSDFPHSISSGFKRITGCRKALEEYHINFDEANMVKYSSLSYEDGYANTQSILKEDDNFTAIFAFSDDMAAGSIAALLDNGKRVPEDISVLGFDNTEISSKFRPAITTVSQPIKDIVIHCLNTLENSEVLSNCNEIILNYQIVERYSCKNLP